MTVYCFHYFVSILHSADNNKEHMHAHTIEIVTHIKSNKDECEQFDDIEKYSKNYLARYENVYLNDLEEFNGDASIENLAEVLYVKLDKLLLDNGYNLERLEMGETPLRTYIISRSL